MTNATATVRVREVCGIVAPYRERTHLLGDIGGRMLMPGLFTRSLAEPRTVALVALLGGDDEAHAVGRLIASEERAEGLFCRFAVDHGPAGDEVLRLVEGGLFGNFEPSYVVMRKERGESGSIEVSEARLHHVDLVAVGTFDSARPLTGRAAERDAMLAPFRNGPQVDLSPLPALR